MSTYAIYGEIVFPATTSRGAIKIRRFNSIKIDSSWKSLTDTAEIVLPRKVRDFDRDNISEVFKEGDPVSILYGYDGDLNEEFSGYISKISVGYPIVITCEDEMYQLKRKPVSISEKNCSVEKLLNTIAPGYKVSCDNAILIGDIRYSKQSATSIMDDLKKKNINFWFEGKTLHAFAVSKKDLDPISITLEKTASQGLKQKAIEEVFVIVKCLQRIAKKGHKYISAQEGSETAGCRIVKEISGMNFSESDLQNEAKAIYKQKTTPGMEGDVTLFGIPKIQHGMKMKISSILYPEKNGIYYVDAITKTVDRSDGIRQICKLGDKAA